MVKVRHLVKLVLAITLAALLSSLAGALGAQARPPQRIDRFVLMKADAQDHWQVWVADQHPRKARQLTFYSANSGFATLSPDGTKIAFDSDVNDPDPNDGPLIDDIFVMNVDGTGVTQLTDSTFGPSGDPAWSPDGSLIAFQSAAGILPERQAIYLMRADGSHLRRITASTAAVTDWTPRFAPDGMHLVFTRYADDGQGSAVFTTDLWGHTKQVTPFDVGAGDAVWSPRGDRIVFEAAKSKGRGDVYTVRADGRHLRNLTNYSGDSGGADPVWSPDGTKILFQQAVLDGSSTRVGLATMSADGTHRHFIQNPPIDYHQPDWRLVPVS
jgi:Tol biopolymer transport system component